MKSFQNRRCVRFASLRFVCTPVTVAAGRSPHVDRWRSGRGGFRGRYGCRVRFRIRDPEAERTERRTVRDHSTRPPHFPTTSNRRHRTLSHGCQRSLHSGLVSCPSTVHARLGARVQLFPPPQTPQPNPTRPPPDVVRASCAQKLCAPPSATRNHVRGSASNAFVHQQHGTSAPPTAPCVSTLTPWPRPSSRFLAPTTR